MSKPPKLVIPGLNRGIGVPPGYVLGRMPGTGQGPAQLLNLTSLRKVGLATGAGVTQSTSTAISIAHSETLSLSSAVSTALGGGRPASGLIGLGLDGEDGQDGTIGLPGVAGAAGATGATGPQGPIGLGLDGLDGQDGIPIPGTPGAAGAAGPAGATGPQGPIGWGLPGEDGQDGIPIPGVPGPAGAAGATGATGPQGPIGLGYDGADGEDGMAIPGAPGAAGAAGAAGNITKPLAAMRALTDFTQINISAAYAITEYSGKGLLIQDTNPGVGFKLAGISRAVPTAPYRVVICVQPSRTPQNYLAWTVGFTDGTKFDLWGQYQDTTPAATTWSDSTTRVTSVAGTGTMPSDTFFISLEDDNAGNCTIGYSPNGIQFVALKSIVKSGGYLGASGYTRLFVGLSNYGSGGASGTANAYSLGVRLWDESGLTRLPFG